MNVGIRNVLNNVYEEVLQAIEQHRKGEKAPLSLGLLLNTKKELEKMMKCMNPKIYAPIYPRFILDWPEERSELVDKLINVSYHYKHIKK